MRHYSRDGSFYNTIDEARAANTRYDQQEKQNNLLEKQLDKQEMQNYLLDQQLKQQQNQIDEQIRLERSKQKREEEIRILKYFDGLNIVKKEYDRFIYKMFNPDLPEKFSKLEKEMDKLILKKEKLLDKLSVQKKENELKILLEKQTNNNSSITISELVFGISILYLLFSFLVLETCSMIALVMAIGGFIAISSYKEQQESIKNDISQYEDIINNKKSKSVDSEDVEKIWIHIELKEKEISKYRNKEIEKNWNKFKNFRLRHYNQKIENFFINVGLDNYVHTYGIKYIKITDKTYIEKGTINDYLEIFQNFETFENHQN